MAARRSEPGGSRARRRRGQATVEYALIYSLVLLPVTFMMIVSSQMLWTFHSAVELVRDGAQYAATHCWQGSGDNVRQYMQTHVPRNLDQLTFQNAGDDIMTISYYSRDADTGELAAFSCDGGECSAECVPDVVTVRIQNYEFRHGFLTFVGIPSVRMPAFATSMPIESAGCDPDQGTCLP